MQADHKLKREKPIMKTLTENCFMQVSNITESTTLWILYIFCLYFVYIL